MRNSTLIATLSLALVAGCNSGGLVSNPVSSPTPTPTPPLQGPVAVIESGSPIYSTVDTATFDGSWSYDLDLTAYITTYEWSIVSKPQSSTSTITLDSSDPTGALADWYIDVAGDYTIQLKVTDSNNLSNTTTYSFSASPSNFHIRLSWPNQYTRADMDLHLIDRTGTTPAPDLWDMQWDCHWQNCKPSEGEFLDWGAAGIGDDDPRLDIDNIETNVPENININTPVNGTYRIEVHYYASHDPSGTDIPVDTNVDVFLGGTLVYSTSETMTAANQVWIVGDVVWSSGGGIVQPIAQMTTTTYGGFMAAPAGNYSGPVGTKNVYHPAH